MPSFSRDAAERWTAFARVQGELTSRGILAALAAYAVIAPSMAWTKADDLLYVLGITAALSLAASCAAGEVTMRWRVVFTPLPVVAVVLAGYVLVSTLWAPSPDVTPKQGVYLLFRALWKPVPNVPVLHALKVIAVFAAAAAVIARLRGYGGRWFFDWFAGAVLLGSLLFLADSFLGYPMIEALFGPPIEYRINANIEALSLLLWPALLVLFVKGRNLLAVALWLVMGFAALRSPSQAAWLGFFAGSAALALTWRWPRAGVSIVTLCAAGGVIAAPVLGSAAEVISSYLPAWFIHEASVPARVEVWLSYALRIEDGPFLGHGFRSNYPGYPTNFALQIWSELGAVGAVLTAAAFGFAGQALLDRDCMCRPWVVATGVAVYAQAYVTLGAWLLPALGTRLLPIVIAAQLCWMVRHTDRR